MAKKDIQKEPVKLREQKLNNGSRSLYLDIYRDGKRKREFLKLYLIEEKTRADKQQNRQTLATAQAIKAKRQIEIQNGEYTFTQQYAEETPFLTYFRQMCEERFKLKGSHGTWGNWRSTLVHLENYCDEKTTFKDIDKKWILGFKDYLNNVESGSHKRTNNKNNALFRGLSQNSKHSYFNKLKACLSQAFEERIIPVNPIRGIEGFKEEEVERDFLTLEELKKLKAAPCAYPWLRSAFLFSCLTGLRKSDIENLTWGKIQNFGEFYRIVFKQIKTNGQEYLDINKQAYELLGNRGKDDEKVFEGFKYSSQTLLELKRWCMAAGIHKDITFHCGRHTFAILMLNLGTDLYTVSKLLGHKNIGTTQIYARVLDKTKQDAILNIPQI